MFKEGFRTALTPGLDVSCGAFCPFCNLSCDQPDVSPHREHGFKRWVCSDFASDGFDAGREHAVFMVGPQANGNARMYHQLGKRYGGEVFKSWAGMGGDERRLSTTVNTFPLDTMPPFRLGRGGMLPPFNLAAGTAEAFCLLPGSSIVYKETEGADFPGSRLWYEQSCEG